DTTIDFTPMATTFFDLTQVLPRSLADRLYTIRMEAIRDGVTIVTPHDSRISKAELEALQDLFGVPVIAVTNETRTQKLDGVVLHLGFARELIKSVRGEINPFYTDAKTLSRIEEGNKALDPLLMKRIAPNDKIMPDTAFVGSDARFSEFLKTWRPRLRDLLEEHIESSRSFFSEKHARELQSLVTEFFKIAETAVGPSFVKYTGEAQTGDTGDLIMTFKTPPEKLVSMFESDLSATQRKTRARRFNTERFQTELLAKEHSATYFFMSILNSPHKLIVQEKVPIAKYAGVNLEVRVDVLYGVPIKAMGRFGNHYIPPEFLAEAYEFVANIMAHPKMPKEWARISGGFDVAFLVPGSRDVPEGSITRIGRHDKVLLELNPGGDPGTVYARIDTLPANQWVAVLKMQPTMILLKLERLYNGTMAAKRQFLASLRRSENHNKSRITQLSRPEVAGWFAERYMNDWDGTYAHGQEILKEFRKLISGFRRESPELNNIERSLEIYISRAPR
ncbi:MAG TPA: hypothetical protein VFV50_11870, partial [Bdellovibrionales bacterium]|nr:hypothetical protein [Bdellovibrionales bacterium]